MVSSPSGQAKGNAIETGACQNALSLWFRLSLCVFSRDKRWNNQKSWKWLSRVECGRNENEKGKSKETYCGEIFRGYFREPLNRSLRCVCVCVCMFAIPCFGPNGHNSILVAAFLVADNKSAMFVATRIT